MPHFWINYNAAGRNPNYEIIVADDGLRVKNVPMGHTEAGPFDSHAEAEAELKRLNTSSGRIGVDVDTFRGTDQEDVEYDAEAIVRAVLCGPEQPDRNVVDGIYVEVDETDGMRFAEVTAVHASVAVGDLSEDDDHDEQ